MNKDTLIIPFPVRNSRKPSLLRQRQQAIKTDKQDDELPEISDIHELMKEQCDVLVGVMQPLVMYVQKGREQSLVNLQATWKQCDALKQRHGDMFKRTSTATNDYNGILRASVALGMAIDCTKTSTDHILGLGLPADRFMLEMAVENKTWAQVLRRGFYKLTTDPFLAKEDACTAHRAKLNAEKIYRCALAELVDASETVTMRKTDGESLNAKSNILGMYERRGVYHRFLKCAKRLGWAAISLREIASQSATHGTLTKELIG